MIRTIVVGTDGSTGGLAALQRAGEIASEFGIGEVHVVTACDPLLGLDVVRIRRELPAEFREVFDPHLPANDRFTEAQDVLDAFGIEEIRHETRGDAVAAIIDVADEVHADLIVVGSRQLGTVARFVHKSVSTRLVRRSQHDVLVVEPEH